MRSKGLIGVFGLLVIALSVLGVAYAHWSKVVTVTGTVKTGKLELKPSCTVSTDDDKQYCTASCEIDVEENTVTVTVDKAYPCITVTIEFDLENTGTIPAGLYKWTVTFEGNDYTIFDAENIPGSEINPGMTEEEVEDALEDFAETLAGDCATVTVDFDGSNFWQIDPGENPTVTITIHFEEDLPQDETYTFTMKLEYWNWNEVGYL